MGYLRVQRLLQILQNSTSSNNSTLQVVNAKALQRLHVEVLVQLLMGRLLCEHPVVELEGDEPIAKIVLKVVLAPSVVEHLLGLEVANKLLHIVVGSLACQKLTRRDVEEGNTTRALAKMNGSQKVVLLVVQHRVLHGHTRRHQLRNASFHQLLGQLGVFQLVADGHPFTSPDELGQIGIKGVMGKSGHLVALVVAVVAMSQRDSQYSRGNDGIFAVSFIEVATTKQQ